MQFTVDLSVSSTIISGNRRKYGDKVLAWQSSGLISCLLLVSILCLGACSTGSSLAGTTGLYLVWPTIYTRHIRQCFLTQYPTYSKWVYVKQLFIPMQFHINVTNQEGDIPAIIIIIIIKGPIALIASKLSYK